MASMLKSDGVWIANMDLPSPPVADAPGLVVAPTLKTSRIVFEGDMYSCAALKDVLAHAVLDCKATWILGADRKFNGALRDMGHSIRPTGPFAAADSDSGGAFDRRLARIAEEVVGEDTTVIMLVSPPRAMVGASALTQYGQCVVQALHAWQPRVNMVLWVTHPTILASILDSYAAYSVEDGVAALQDMLGYTSVEVSKVHVKLSPMQGASILAASVCARDGIRYPFRLNSDGDWTASIPSALHNAKLVAAGTESVAGALFTLHVDGFKCPVLPWLSKPPENNDIRLLDNVRQLVSKVDYSSLEGALVRDAMLAQLQSYPRGFGAGFGEGAALRTASMAPFVSPCM